MLITESPWPETLDEFVERLADLYRRQVTDTHEVVWCPEWWRHPEVVFRLEALWRAGRALKNSGGDMWATVWMRDHVDVHMKRVMDPQGVLRFCSVRNGHKDLLDPLPLSPRPAAAHLKAASPAA